MSILTTLSFGIMIFAVVWLFGGNIIKSLSKMGDPDEPRPDFLNNPLIPDFIEKAPGKAVAYLIIGVLILTTAIDCIHSVPPGHRGVIVTFGKVEEVNLGEGLQFKLPYVQKIVDMKVVLEKEEVQESAASSDLQESVFC